MSSDNFELHYKGEATNKHSMDLAVTRDVLSAVDYLIKRIAEKTDKSKDVAIQVQAFKEGSFGIEFGIFDGISLTATHIMMLLGVTATTHGGILGYLDWRNGRTQLEMHEQQDGTINVVDTETGEQKSTLKEIIKLVSDRKLVDKLHRIFVEPMEKLDLDSILLTKGKAVIATYPRSRVDCFANPELSRQTDNDTLPYIVTVEQVALTDGGRWRVRMQGHNASISANMEDQVFIAKVDCGEVTFKAKDQMEVVMTKRTEMKGLRKTNTYTIDSVVRHWHTTD